MFPTRATQTLTIGKRRLRDFKCQHEWKKSENIFYVKDAALSSSETIPAYSYTHPRNCRLFTTTTKEIRKSGRNTRKKKPLVQPNQKVTTKDRLRLATRPSSSTKKNQNKESDDLMIQSPEELMERLNIGLDMARTAVKEGYATLRNPKAGDQQGNHLLSARPSGSSKGSRPALPEGLVMDANWWFWNLLFAASPAILIALYCEFIVKPEMKVRHDEKDQEEREKNESSQGNEPGSTSPGGSSNKKMSSMRMRQEQEQKLKKQKLPENQAASSQVSPSPPMDRNDLNDMVTFYSRVLVSLFSGEPIVSAPKHGQSHKNETKDVETNGTQPAVDIDQTQDKELSLEVQQQELNELQLQLQRLQDKIIRQQRERAGSNAISDSDVSDDTSINTAKPGSLSSIGNFVKGTTAAGINIGKEQVGSLLIWWQGHDPASDDRRKNQIVSTDAETHTEKSND